MKFLVNLENGFEDDSNDEQTPSRTIKIMAEKLKITESGHAVFLNGETAIRVLSPHTYLDIKEVPSE